MEIFANRVDRLEGRIYLFAQCFRRIARNRFSSRNAVSISHVDVNDETLQIMKTIEITNASPNKSFE